ncbi:MAG: hypothetical protein SGARI_004344 [Bacillariaceae sp.]
MATSNADLDALCLPSSDDEEPEVNPNAKADDADDGVGGDSLLPTDHPCVHCCATKAGLHVGNCVVYKFATFLYVKYVQAGSDKTLVAAKQKRYLLYKAMLVKVYGPLVQGVHEELPSCVLQLIRHWFPSPDGKYSEDIDDPGAEVLRRSLNWVDTGGDVVLPEAMKLYNREEWKSLRRVEGKV